MTDWGNVSIASPYDDSPDSEVASPDELSGVINGGIPIVAPIPRYNPNMPYAEVFVQLDDKDKILLKAISKAISNGWEGWRMYTNDAVTIGMEAEVLITTMKKKNLNARNLLLDQDFAKFLWGEDYADRLKDLVLAPDVIMFLKSNL